MGSEVELGGALLKVNKVKDCLIQRHNLGDSN